MNAIPRPARPSVTPATATAGPGRGPASSEPLVLLLSAAHPPVDMRVVAKEGAALADAGWRVRHLAPLPATGGALPAEAHGVAIEAYPRPHRRRGWLGRVLGVPTLARRAAATGAAVLHASEPDAWVAALLAARLAPRQRSADGGRPRRPRVVLDVHEHYPSRLDSRLPPALRPVGRALLRLFCRAAGRMADAVVVAKDGLDGDFGRPGGAVRIVPVRNYALALPVTPRRHMQGPVTLLHLGALGQERGAFTMLSALALCPADTRLRLIGRFTDGSEPAFLERAETLGLSGRVERVPWLPAEEALARAAQADIGLVLFQPGVENHRLALPHKLFDCMLAGLPVIVPRFATEVATVVEEAGCGLAVDTSDPEEVADAVLALSDPCVRQAMGERGRKAALTRFGWAGEAARLVALYRDLIGPPPPSAASARPAVREA